MAAARFCSDCGERILSKRLRYLPFRAFCSRCSSRFNRARLLSIVALASCAVTGFAIGHFTAAPEPFYYIGTPIGPGSAQSIQAADGKPAHSSRSSEGLTQPERPVSSTPGIDRICGALTRSGKPCQRKVKGGGYCWQHRSKPANQQVPPNTQ